MTHINPLSSRYGYPDKQAFHPTDEFALVEVKKGPDRHEEYQSERTWSNTFASGWETLTNYFYQWLPHPIHGVTQPSVFVVKERLDPEICSNACKILQIPQEKVGDLDLLDTQYQKIIEGLKKRRSQVPDYFALSIERLIEDSTTAHRTLKEAWK